MKKSKFLAISLMCTFLLSMTITMTITIKTQGYIPEEEVHFYRFLDDDASYLGAVNAAWGGVGYVEYGDMDYLEMYADTDGWLESSLVQEWFDGGDDANSPWTFSYNEYYYMYMVWDISGYFTRDHSNYMSFYYALYYMVGSTQHIVISNTITYESDFDYDNVLVSHYVGSANLDTSKTYYVYGRIILSHSTWSVSTSDFYYGANHLDFVRADFKCYM